MQQAINDVKESIAEANLELIELNNNIRDLEWEYFDYAEDRISQITSEADFLIDLLSSSDLYTDNGQFTDAGLASLGLHATSYNTYMAQSDDYAEQIAAINEELKDDPYNTTLIEALENYTALQQEAILNAENEKAAMIELATDGYDLMLDYLSDLIDAYEDSLDSAQD